MATYTPEQLARVKSTLGPLLTAANVARAAGALPSAKTTTPTAPVAPTSPAPVDRTAAVGALATAQNDARITEDTYKKAQQDADMYAATQRQSRIDAINTAFGPRIAREQQAGQERLQRVSAINFNAGLVGSPASTTKTGEQTKLNDEALRAIEDEKAMLISDAFAQADQLAVQRAQSAVEQKKSIAESNVSYYQGQADKAISALQSFGKSSTDLATIKTADPNTYATLRDVSGLSDLQMQAILNQNAPEPQNVDTRYENGYLISTYFDPKTKKFQTYTEKLNIPETKKASDIQVLTGADGRFYAFDKTTNSVVNTFGTMKKETGTSLITSEDKRTLLGASLSLDDIDNIENDIRTHGVDAVVGNLSSKKQKDAVQKVFGGVESIQFLNDKFLRSQYENAGIEEMLKTLGKDRSDYAAIFSGKKAEETNIKDDYKKYLDESIPRILSTVEQYRAAGFSDKEILTKLQ